MSSPTAGIIARCRKLGLECTELPTDRLSSVLAALACFPMYMVANVQAWTNHRQWHVPIVDIPGLEHIREAFAIGKQQAEFELIREHRRALATLLTHAKPSDLVIYEYAIETLRQSFEVLNPILADEVRTAVAQMVVAVARASGEGILGTGEKVSREERDCIAFLDRELALSSASHAADILGSLG